MRVLVTGANGFVGKNLISFLKVQGVDEIYLYDKETDKSLLDVYTQKCDFVFHLAGVNRPKVENEFIKGNYDFTNELLLYLEKHHNPSPIVMSSTIQALLDNPYGISKKAGEDVLIEYATRNNIDVYIYRLTNLFGKWSKPNYNSVVATFCNNIALGEPISVNSPDTIIELGYIDDLINEFYQVLIGNIEEKMSYYKMKTTHSVTLKKLSETLLRFKQCRINLEVPNMKDEFESKLYSTYLSYLKTDDFSYPLKMNVDDRGSFTEILKLAERGQVSVNIIKAGITKGNHWHRSKNEKFLIVSGEGVIRFRKIESDIIYEYKKSGEKLEVVDIPTGYTHNISNTGTTDLVTIMWVNEYFNSENPDTFYLEV